MARSLRVQFEGAVYYIVIRANNRQSLFKDRRDRSRFLDLLNRYQGRFGFVVYAYTLVPHYVHLLVGTPKGNVSKVMQCLGTSYTSYFNRRHRRRGTLFEGRYKSYLVDNEGYLAEVTRYIHQAYSQSGLSTIKKRDYPWSSYRIYLGRKMSDLVQTEPVLGRFGGVLRVQRKRYQEFVEEGIGTKRKGYFAGVKFGPLFSSAKVAGGAFFKPQHPIPSENETHLRKAEQILREVNLSLNPSEIGDLRDGRRRALARHLAMYLIRRHTSLPLRSIGELLGVKAPAVALALGKVEQLLKQEEFSEKVRKLLGNDMFASSEVMGDYSPGKGEMSDGNATA